LGELRERNQPLADLIIVNGFPQPENTVSKPGDRVVFIGRGMIPEPDELEFLMAARHSPGVHRRMKQASVGIAGLGGLGSAVAVALARMGVGNLILADFDRVEPSNLNRQQYFLKDLGRFKTEALSEILASINPYLNIGSHPVVLDRENIPVFFKEAKVVVECFDRPEAKVMILQAVAEFLPQAYLIGASGVAGYGASNSIRTLRLGQRIFMVGDFVSAAGPGQGLMAPRVGIAAHHQANLAVSLLMDPENLTL
jgi:sulfur carrier protein ThiS adenylyltransferase